jgi:hypothetical protein
LEDGSNDYKFVDFGYDLMFFIFLEIGSKKMMRSVCLIQIVHGLFQNRVCHASKPIGTRQRFFLERRRLGLVDKYYKIATGPIYLYYFIFFFSFQVHF